MLGVQVTELDDGIFIGCTVNHSVTDGTSFWHFLNSWSEISRGAVDLSKHPVFERSYLKDHTDGPVRIPNSQLKQIHDEHIPLPLDENVLHFTRESIAKLKAKANAEVGSNKISSLQAVLAHVWRSVYRTKQLDPNEEISHGLAFSVRPRLRSMPQEYFGNAVQFGAKANAEVGSNKISSLQAVLAHVWRSVYRTKQLDPNEEISHGLAFSVRPRLRSMPQEYFGNAVQFGGLTLKARELLEGGLGNVALQMNRTVAAQTEETMSNFLRSWPKSPVLITPGMVNAVNGLFGIGSHRYDAYGNDFGWGRPIALRSGSGNKLNGMMVVCPGVEDGSIEIEACLPPETLHALVNDQDFVGADDHEFHALEMVG
ncbi:hypothetical protein SLEP1_g8216 [Rubroshorea leprosula]|uniref:BAHD acyltransferase n=1 Tax=Rubroshorea leprosula TaxID=152421 RepID=A0AAV5I9A0_9ROSI|nr:hypothetical protein SLEP1_g8216 [Rubroshorea leprosula]